jgi:hypothetical protein
MINEEERRTYLQIAKTLTEIMEFGSYIVDIRVLNKTLMIFAQTWQEGYLPQYKQWVIEDIQKPLKAAHIMREILEAASCEVNILRKSN